MITFILLNISSLISLLSIYISSSLAMSMSLFYLGELVNTYEPSHLHKSLMSCQTNNFLRILRNFIPLNDFYWYVLTYSSDFSNFIVSSYKKLHISKYSGTWRILIDLICTTCARIIPFVRCILVSPHTIASLDLLLKSLYVDGCVSVPTYSRET